MLSLWDEHAPHLMLYPWFLSLVHSSIYCFPKDILCFKLGSIAATFARPLPTHSPSQAPLCNSLHYITFHVGTMTWIHIVSCIRLSTFQSLRPRFIHLCVPVVFSNALGLVTFSVVINELNRSLTSSGSVIQYHPRLSIFAIPI